MNRPIYDMLTSSSGRVSCHMPGHKGKSPCGAYSLHSLDTTELPVTDDLYCPENGIYEAEILYASSARAGKTIFLHNGSTSGVQALVQLYCSQGDSILLARNAHMSAVNGCAVGGIDVEWIPMTMLPSGYMTVTEDDVLSAMKSHPMCKAVLITRPDYYGGCISLTRIVSSAHELGMKVVVDEAHGAHLPWLSSAMEAEGLTPVKSSGDLGCDAWVQSVHKTLPALTGSAVLNLKNPADYPAAIRILRRTMTSSPNFVMMMSVDDSRAFMDSEGITRLKMLMENCDKLRLRMITSGYGDAQALWKSQHLEFDPTRIVISAPQGGKKLAEQLAELGIDVEMWDNFRVVLIMTVMDDTDVFEKIASALDNIATFDEHISVPPYSTEIPEKAMSVRRACFGRTELVPVEHAIGRVAAQSAGLYPPGIPLICPGEVFKENIISVLRSAKPQERFGIEGDKLLCTSV